MYSPTHIKQENQNKIGETSRKDLQILSDRNRLIIDEPLNTPIIDIHRASQFFKTLNIENQPVLNNNTNLNDQLDQISINNSYDQLIKIQKNLDHFTTSEHLISELFNKNQYYPEMESSYEGEMYKSLNIDTNLEELVIFDTDRNMNMFFNDYFSEDDIKEHSRKDSLFSSTDPNVLITDIHKKSDILYKDIMITGHEIPIPLLGEEINFEFNDANIYGHTDCINTDELLNKQLNENVTSLPFIVSENYSSIEELQIDATINNLNGFEQILNVSEINNINFNNKVEETNINIDNNPQIKLSQSDIKIKIPDIEDITEIKPLISTPEINDIFLNCKNDHFDLVSFIISANDKKEDISVEIKHKRQHDNGEKEFPKKIRLTDSDNFCTSAESSLSVSVPTVVAPRRRGRPPITENSLPNPTHYQHLSEKDAKYVEMRNKNNLASRRSRMNRKHRELNIEDEAQLLETKNRSLEKKEQKLEKLIKKWEKYVMDLASL